MQVIRVACMAMTSLVALATNARTVCVDEFVQKGAVDDTAAFQAAIDSGADEVVVPAREMPWVVRPLFGRSNMTLIFARGTVVESKKGSFEGRKDSLLTFDCCTNVSVRGRGATIRMHRLDYQAAPYKRSEWRHGLAFLSCTDVTVEGLEIVETGGDGIYLGVNVAKDPEQSNFRVTIRDVICARNHRQGISVISAEDLLVENCELRETCGTSPEAGIDFEPNSPAQRFVNCCLRNCRLSNNMGSGVEIWCPRFDATTRPVSILVENCETECNCEEIRFRDYSRKYGRAKSLPGGTVTFRNCTFRNVRNEYLYVGHETGRGISLRLEGCSFFDDPNPGRMSLKKAARIFDDAPGVMKALAPLAQVGNVGYAVCSDGAKRISLVANVGKTSSIPLRKGKQDKKFVVATVLPVLDCEGREIACVKLPADEFSGTVKWSFDVPAAGVYSFGGFANRSVSILEANVPIAVEVATSGRLFSKAAGSLYAYVPAGTPRLVVTVGGGRDGRVGIAMFDPDGRLRGRRTWTEASERYSFRNPEKGLWRFELGKPDPAGEFNLYGFDVIGGLGYLFLDKDRTWR